MEFLSVGQVMLLLLLLLLAAVVVSCVCERRCLYGHSNSSVSQSVSQCMEKDRQGLAGGVRTEGSTGERGRFKGLSPVSNSSQRDYTMLSSLFNLRLKRAALCFFSISLFPSLSPGPHFM